MRRFAPLVALVLAAAALAGSTPPAAAYPGAPWFKPGEPYTQNFPDPSVFYDGATGSYYAYGTTTGGAYLPVMYSGDASTWIARDEYPQPDCVPFEDDPFYNDALPCPAPWALELRPGSRISRDIWAPGVARIGDRFVAFYAARITREREEFCLAVATSTSPLGPFVDARSDPFLCDRRFPNGVIDPQPFVDPSNGTPYLIWKTEGRLDGTETAFYVQQLSPDGVSFAAGSQPAQVLETTDNTWEGDVIESPSMVFHGGRWLLFYSANEWTSRDYATGVAFCNGPLGPCTKSPANPILRSNGNIAGPGGPSAFVDATGALRLAYHHWTEPHVGYPTEAEAGCDGTDPDTHQPYCISRGQRRLRVDYATVQGDGVTVSAAPPPVVTARNIDSGCPTTLVPRPYADVDMGSGAARAISCITAWGVTSGTGAGTYNPGGFVNREQMASFVARLIEATDAQLPAGGDAFDDDSTSGHQDNINRLAAAGIVTGTAPRQYSPQAQVTRAQMATFLIRAAQYVTQAAVPVGNDSFSDDDTSNHQNNINAAAGAGIATGTGPGAFSPTLPVSRAQMASFLARLLDFIVDAGLASPPTV